jgi:hypothetical protein
MKGNRRIGEILQKEYGVKDLYIYEDITYEIERFSDKVSRVTIKSNKNGCFCPVYAMFDRHFMQWYGDYGPWGFDCTWETDVMNLAYHSPYYQLEKLDSRETTEFDDQFCRENLIKKIKESTFYEDDLTEDEKARFDEFIESDYEYIDYEDELYCHQEDCEKLQELLKATNDEHEWISAVRNMDFDEDEVSYFFGCEEYELYSIGQKEPVRFFIILYLLSVVCEAEKALAETTDKNLQE